MATGPAATLKRLWRQNRWLTIAFALTLTLALVFLIRAGVFFVYWQQHQDEPIEGWMTVRYIARSYRVEPRIIRDAIGLKQTGPDRRPLVRIAREDGRPLDEMMRQILEAIRADRAVGGRDPGKLPAPVIAPPEPASNASPRP